RGLGGQTPGEAQREIDSGPSPGTSNFVLAAGETAPEALYSDIQQGLYLTDLMGFGVNMTTGDFSRGAQGFWIENGRLAYPVTEINVSGNLKDMLKGIEALGNDVLWRGGAAAPSLRMER